MLKPDQRPCEHGISGPCKRCVLDANIAHAQQSALGRERGFDRGRQVDRRPFLDELDGDFS